jgi:hypothetical protein
MEKPDPAAGPKMHIAGAIAMVVIGLLILIPSGLCTGVIGGGALINGFLHPGYIGGTLSMFVMALMVGGPFVVGGGALMWFGVKRLRGR